MTSTTPPTTTLFVSNFPPSISASTLARDFEHLDASIDVACCDIIRPPTGKKPFAFLKFDTIEDAKRVMEIVERKGGVRGYFVEFAKNPTRIYSPPPSSNRSTSPARSLSEEPERRSKNHRRLGSSRSRSRSKRRRERRRKARSESSSSSSRSRSRSYDRRENGRRYRDEKVDGDDERRVRSRHGKRRSDEGYAKSSKRSSRKRSPEDDEERGRSKRPRSFSPGYHRQ